MVGQTVFTASRRLDQRLQLWDLEACTAVDIEWPEPSLSFMPACAKMSPDGDFFAVGGGGEGLKDGAFVFDKNGKVVADLKTEAGVSACCFGSRDPVVAFADGIGCVNVLQNKYAKQ